MPQTQIQIVTLKNVLKLFVWTATLLAALSITNSPGNWGHSVCGVWGCGPPTQVLVGCHLAWLIVLIPLAMIVSRSFHRTIGPPQHFGKILCVVGAILVMTVVMYQWATWLPAVSDWQRKYFLQRCGFTIATCVEIPMLQLLAIGLVMIRQGRRSSVLPTKSAFSPETGEARL